MELRPRLDQVGMGWVRARGGAGRLLRYVTSLRLPAPSILPVTGALVGIYAGLAAGLFANLIAAIQLFGFGLPRVARRLAGDVHPVRESLSRAPWRLEYLVAGTLLAVGLLLLAQLVPAGSGGPDAPARAETRTRLRVIASLVLGGLALFYPIVALAAVNEAFGLAPMGGLSGLLAEAPLPLRPLLAAVGGVLVARVLRWAPEARGGGLGQVVQAVSRMGGGVIPTRVGLVKLIASSLTIGTGGSAGREGPIVQMGGSVGSTVARALRFSRRDLVVLVGCGSAGGIAASFNAPIAGAMFALEIILREFEVRVFAPIVLASVTATMTARALLGEQVPHHHFRLQSTPEILAYVGVGLVGGAMALAYVRGMELSSALFDGRLASRLSRWLGRQSAELRCLLGGLLVGAIGLAVPQVMGSGQESLGAALRGELLWQLLLAAALLKVVTTALTLGSGASGGTFYPALFIGAMSGGCVGVLLERLFPGTTGGPGSYALVGMAACVAGSTRAPLTAIVIAFELTNDYTAILPLMVACTTASALCQGVLGHAHGPGSLLAAIPDRAVRTLMSVAEQAVPARTGFEELRERLLASRHGVLPLVDGSGNLTGLAVLRDIQELLREESLGALVLAQDVARPPHALSAELDLRSALEQLEDWELPAAPVVAPEDPRRVVGMLAVAEIRAAARVALAAQAPSAH
jgi:CIC family chloride channel protein